MAPPKKLKAETEGANHDEVNPTAEVAPGRRVTRSLTRRGDSPPAAPPQQQQPPKKKARKAKAEASSPAPAPLDDGVAGDVNGKVSEMKDDDGFASGSRTIVIERCTQCQCFRKGADQVKEGLEKAIPGISVLINPEKPRRGCFEVREEGGQTFISLQGLKRPFKPLKDLDKEEVITDIVAKLQA